MRLSDDERKAILPLLQRVRDEATSTLEDLTDGDPTGPGIYELDGAVTDLFEYLNASGIADRAAFT